MSSGVKLSDETKRLFADIKNGHKFETVLLKMNDARTEVVLAQSFEKHTFNELVKVISDDYLLEPLFILHDFHDVNKSGVNVNALFYFTWCSDDSPIKKRMIFASTSSEVKKSADGFKVLPHATDLSDLTGLREAAIAKAEIK